MDLRQIRYFVVLAEQLHFGRAAELLHVAQPPLSQQIKALGAELRVTLIDRSTRPIALTPAGQALLREGRELLTQSARAQAAARHADAGDPSRLAVGITGSAALEFGGPLLKAFGAAHPSVQLSLREMSSPAQLTALESGSIQIGFVRPPVSDERFSIRLVHTEPLFVALPSDLPEAGHQAIRLKDLRGLPLVIFERKEAPGFRDLILHVCRSAGYIPTFIQDASQMSTILCLVGGGHGIALVPRCAQRMAISGVAFRPLLDEASKVELYAAWLPNNLSHHVENLLAAIDVARARYE